MIVAPSRKRSKRPARPVSPPRLQEPGWSPRTRERLEHWIQEGAGQGLAAVFDFDNTVVCGDIGEATLACLVRDGILKLQQLPETLAPAFRDRAGNSIGRGTQPDATAYYEALLDPTAHGAGDPAPLASGYVWAVEAMTGLSVREVVQATQRVHALAEPGKVRLLEVRPGGAAYPLPWFYPESVELISELVKAEFEVWVVSASNVWSVRWMVLHALNPLLRARGIRRLLRADHVVGVSTLLQDGDGQLFKDSVLVREQADYAALADARTGGLRLTSRLQFPVPTYSGKVACLWDLLGSRPYFAAGDSPGDHAMLAFSERRLWISRLEKPAYLEATRRLARRTEPAQWLFQDVRTKAEPGFVRGPERPAR